MGKPCEKPSVLIVLPDNRRQPELVEKMYGKLAPAPPMMLESRGHSGPKVGNFFGNNTAVDGRSSIFRGLAGRVWRTAFRQWAVSTNRDVRVDAIDNSLERLSSAFPLLPVATKRPTKAQILADACNPVATQRLKVALTGV